MADQAALLARAKMLQQAKLIQSQKMAEAQAAAAPPPPPESRMGEAALQGFGKGATLGYLPEMQARAEQGLNAILPQSMGGGDDLTYEQRLENWRKRSSGLEEQHPVVSGVGNVAGSLATMPVGGGAAKGASLLAKTARAAGTGAAYGAAMNPEAEMTLEEQLKARLKNAGIGALAGGAGEGVIGTGANLLKKTGEMMQKSSVLKQIGANAGQIKKVLQKDELPKIQTFLKEQKLMRLGKDTEAVAERAQQVLDTDGPAIGKLYEDAAAAAETIGIGQGNRINGPELAEEIIKDARAKYKNHANRDIVMKEIETAVAPLRDMGESANLVDVHSFRKSLDENINWSQKAQERDAVQKVFIDARNKVSDKTKQVVTALDDSLGTAETAKLKQLNERYSSAATVNNIATQGAAREKARAFLGQGVLGVGAGGIAAASELQRSGDPLKAFGVGMATSVGVTTARKYGTPLTYGAGKVASGLGSAAEAVASRPGEIGLGLTSPWVQMREKEKKK